MSDGFSRQDIDKIADLANLDLTEEEKELFSIQFGSILEHFNTIQSIPLPTELDESGAGSAIETLREDVAEASGVFPDQFSPHLEARQFKVPKVIE